MVNRLADDLDHILDHTRELWEELRGERIFITGGTGLFGCWLLESFAWANDRLSLGAQAVVLTRNPQAFHKKAPHLANHPAVHLYPGDVRSFPFPPGHFSHIIHAATESSARLNDENPLIMLDTIIQGTRHALDFAVQGGTGKFLLISSGAVYGKQPPDLSHIPEEYNGAPDPLDPRSAYGLGKRTAEHLGVLFAAQSEIQVKIARCFTFAGPYMPLNAHFAIGNFIRDGMNGGPIIIQGDGTAVRSYLYAADLAVWLLTILIRGESQRAYNVGSEAEITVAELARLVSQRFETPIQIVICGKPEQSVPGQRYLPFTRRAEAELGLRVWVNVSQIIFQTIVWAKATLNHWDA